MKSKKAKILLALVVLVILVLVVGLFYLQGLDEAKDPSDTELRTVEIVAGSSTTDIGDTLEAAGIIEDSGRFRLFSKIKGYDGKYMAGTYPLSPAMTPSEIAAILMSGITPGVDFTIQEGLNTKEIAEKLDQQGICSAEDFLNEAENGTFDYAFLDGDVTGIYRLEGFLFPDTYSLPVDADAHTIISIFLDNFDAKFTPEMRQQAKDRGMTISEVVTVASLVEKEAKKDEERPIVASVIYNRMEQGMKLELCSTIQFLLGEAKEELTYDDLAIESPYNTYTEVGLPPGPIGNPGLSSLQAAVEPADTEYLYFVVSEKLDGSHNFSKDYAKFEQDKEAYWNAYDAAKGN